MQCFGFRGLVVAQHRLASRACFCLLLELHSPCFPAHIQMNSDHIFEAPA